MRLTGSLNGTDVSRHAGLLAIPVLFSTGHFPATRDLIRAIHVIERMLGGFPTGDVPEAMRIFVERR